MSHLKMSLQEFLNPDLNPDLLNPLDFAPGVFENLKTAREIAADTILKLEPRHILGMKDLEDALRNALKNVEMEQFLRQFK